MYRTDEELNALSARVNGRMAAARSRVNASMNGRVPEEIQYATRQTLQMHPDVLEKEQQKYGRHAWAQSVEAMNKLGGKLGGNNG
jgi:hypothetical protein